MREPLFCSSLHIPDFIYCHIYINKVAKTFFCSFVISFPFPAGDDVAARGRVTERLSSFKARSAESSTSNESSASRRAELESLEGSTQAARARLAEEQVRT